jgi:hypothetical protein
MSARSKILAAAAVLLLGWFARLVWDYFNEGTIAHQAMQVQLKLFGAAMYEYHSATGRWPTSVDDLAKTSLPQRSYVWRQTAGTLTFLWPTDLYPDPKQNANVLLAYDNAGLFNKLERVWVCWGDLRTEHMLERDLRVRLGPSNGPRATSFQKAL